MRFSDSRAISEDEGLQVAVEVEGVVAALAANAGEPATAEGGGQVTHQEGVGPHDPGPHRGGDPLGSG